ncbi:MAG TPA: ubiquinol-cytochrome c reductase cytochrome b subunit, partial [Microbacterium sp.]|nr:ubiquinol-cytochrome c reductase cytochrome b subunit [Microbacterium sp.]
PVAVLGLFIVVVALYPFIEMWVTGDKREHHIADRPRNAATRTAIGVAGMIFYSVLWAAASSDLMATHFMLTMEGVIHTLQALLFVGPVLGYFITKRICIALQKKDREIVLHGYESGRIVRLPGGEFIEVHQPVDVYDRWKLVDYETYQPLVVRPNAKGRIPWHENLRSSLSRWFYEDRLQPLTQAQIEEADAHQQHALAHDAEIEAEEIAGAHTRAGVTDESQIEAPDKTVGETPNTPSSVIAKDPAPRKKKSENGE